MRFVLSKCRSCMALWSVCFVVGQALTNTVVAANRWPDEKRFGSFIFHADFSLAQHAKLLKETEQLQRDVEQTLQLGESREMVHLFLFSKKTNYQRYLTQYFPKVPFRRALFIKRQGPGMVFAYLNREFDVDVRHESTHALLHARLDHVPLWLDEGLAEYFEVPSEKRGHDNPHFTTLRRELFFFAPARIESLENIQSLDQMGSTQYRYAWSWVHFMLHGPVEAHDELVRYLADIKSGVAPGRLSERLRRRVPNLEKRYAEHFKNWRR